MVYERNCASVVMLCGMVEDEEVRGVAWWRVRGVAWWRVRGVEGEGHALRSSGGEGCAL